MEIMLVRRVNGLVPATAQDVEKLATLKQEQGVKAKITRVRNIRHHRKLFALLNLMLASTEKYHTIEDLLTEVKLRVGHYEEHVTLDGEVIYIPKSIAVQNMDQGEFEVFYNRVVDVGLQHFLPGMNEDELENAVLQYMSFL